VKEESVNHGHLSLLILVFSIYLVRKECQKFTKKGLYSNTLHMGASFAT